MPLVTEFRPDRAELAGVPKSMTKALTPKALTDENGQTAVEYALVLLTVLLLAVGLGLGLTGLLDSVIVTVRSLF